MSDYSYLSVVGQPRGEYREALICGEWGDTYSSLTPRSVVSMKLPRVWLLRVLFFRPK